MKVCHFSNWAPRQSGMYENTKDQIKYERGAGLQSELVVSHNENPKDSEDDWLKPITWEESKDADIWVMHSCIPEKLKPLFKDKVTVAWLHGPTEHMILLEWASKREDTKFNLHINVLWKYDATVALNQHCYEIMKLYDEHDKLHYIPNSIDLENYPVDEYAWHYQYHPAIIACDTPRIEKLPAHIIWAMPRIRELIPGAKLNLFSLSLEPIGMWRNIFCRSKKRALEGACENIQLENNDLRPFMRGADIHFSEIISPVISRVVMESMAMGLPVVGRPILQNGKPYTKYTIDVFGLDSIAKQVDKCWKDIVKDKNRVREESIKFAQENFNRAIEVKKHIKLYEELSKKKYGKVL